MNQSTAIRFVAICLLLLVASEVAVAQQEGFSLDVDLNLNDNDVDNICFLLVEEDAPYAALSADCRVYRRYGLGEDYQEVLIASNEFRDVQIPFPRSEPYSARWTAVAWNTPPDIESVYCAAIGIEDENGSGDIADLQVVFAHHSDSDLNVSETDPPTECRSPEPKLNVYYQTTCIGWYVQVFSIEGLQQSWLYKSWSEIAHPAFCFSMAVETSQ